MCIRDRRISLLYVPHSGKWVGILTDSCLKFDVFAFSAPDFAARRTIVRLVRRNRTRQTILSLPHSVGAKKAQTEKTKTDYYN